MPDKYSPSSNHLLGKGSVFFAPVAVGALLIRRLLGLGGESIGEDVGEATPAPFDLGGDGAMTMKASHTSLGKQQGANITTKKAAPHEATASGPTQADEAMTTQQR